MDPLGTGFSAPESEHVQSPSAGFQAPDHERVGGFSAPPEEHQPALQPIRDETVAAGGTPSWVAQADGEIRAKEAGHQLTETAPGQFAVQQGPSRQLSTGEKIAIYDAHRAKEGFGAPGQEYGQTMAQRAAEAQQQQVANQGAYTNAANAASQKLAQFGTNIVGLVAPQTATNLQQNVQAATPYDPNTASGFAGEVVGNTLPLVPGMVAPEVAGLATATAAGAGQAGAVRQEVAQKRASGQNISGLQEAADAGLQAATMFLAQRASVGRLTKPLAPLSEVERQSMRNVVEQAIANTIRNSRVQGSDFAAMQIANNVIDKATGVAPEKNAMEGVGESAMTGMAQGAIGTALHGATTQTPKAYVPPEAMLQKLEASVEKLKTAPKGEPNVATGTVPERVESQPQTEAPPVHPEAAPVEARTPAVQEGQSREQATGRPILDQANPKTRVTNGAESQGVPLEFESPEEKALYLATVPRKGKVALEAAAYLAEKGYKPEAISRYGDDLRARIDGLAKQPPAEGHPLFVPMLGEEETAQKAEARLPAEKPAGPAEQAAPVVKDMLPGELPARHDTMRDQRDEALESAMPGARVVKSGLSPAHQEVLNVFKELTGQEAVPYMMGRGRGFRSSDGRVFYNVEQNKTPQLQREAIAHEATHVLQEKRPDLVRKLDAAIPAPTRKSLLAEYQKSYQRQEGKALPTEQHDREIQAMVVGRAFSRSSVAREVLRSNPGAFAKAADFVMNRLRGLTSGGRLTNQVIDFLKQARQQAGTNEEPATRHVGEKEAADFLPQSHDRIRDEAEEYATKAGITYHPDHAYDAVNEERAKRIADQYAALKHEPNDPLVKRSYDAFKNETMAQYHFLQDKGIKFEPWTGEGQPYKDSADMMKDARENKHMFFFQGGELPEDHPLAANAPGTPYTYNDVFRAVHDYFGHAKEGTGFGPRGEENAWKAHSQLYSDEARPAMTTETRGQNSWVNFGPHGEHNRANPQDTIYAQQKAGLLPEEYWANRTPVEMKTSPPEREFLQRTSREKAGANVPSFPGANEFLPGRKAANKFNQEDVQPALVKMKEGFEDAWEGVKNFMGVQSGDKAAVTKEILRQRGAELAQRFDRLNTALSEAKDWMEKNLTKAEKYGFIDQMERGPQATQPELQPIHDALRSLFDDRLKQMQGHGKLQQFVMDYFPHLWKDPAKAALWASDASAAKRPFEGTKGFLRQRTLPYFLDGISKGLEPVSDNPVELSMLRLRQMDKYITAQDALKDLHSRGLLKRIPARGLVPEGYKEIDDPIGKVYAPPNRKGGLSIAARWVAPDAAASVINNHLSPGLRGDPAFGGAFRAYLGLGNAMNQVQLGLSGFHALATSFNSVIGKTALGLKYAATGELGEAGKAFASAPIAVAQDIWNGSKMLKEWNEPGSTDPQTAAYVNFLKQAGGRAGADEFYQTHATAKFMQAIKDGNPIGAALRLPSATLDTFSKPLMNWFVPRMKLGAFMDMARFEMNRLGPNASPDQLRSAAHKAWDSVDNRFGQLVYDNLFWNKAAKDLAMASMRSVGWNLGTFRELGGAIKDVGSAAISLGKGQKPELTHRMAYAVSLPVVTGAIGGMIHYALTGKHPEELKDWFFPKTGEQDKEGHDVRLALPTYMKDVYAFKKDPLATITHKVHPMLNTIMEMLANKDYYGTKIRNEDDPFMKQAADLAKHVGAGFVPFGTREVKKLAGEGQGARSLLPLVGITQARRDITNSPAELKASELMQERLPRGARTQEQADKSKMEAELRGNVSRNEPDAITKLRAAVEGKQITPEEARTIRANAKYGTSLERNVHHLDMHDAMSVWDLASDAEKKKLGPILLAKVRGSKTLTLDQRRQYMQTITADVKRLKVAVPAAAEE